MYLHTSVISYLYFCIYLYLWKTLDMLQSVLKCSIIRGEL